MRKEDLFFPPHNAKGCLLSEYHSCEGLARLGPIGIVQYQAIPVFTTRSLLEKLGRNINSVPNAYMWFSHSKELIVIINEKVSCLSELISLMDQNDKKEIIKVLPELLNLIEQKVNED